MDRKNVGLSIAFALGLLFVGLGYTLRADLNRYLGTIFAVFGVILIIASALGMYGNLGVKRSDTSGSDLNFAIIENRQEKRGEEYVRILRLNPLKKLSKKNLRICCDLPFMSMRFCIQKSGGESIGFPWIPGISPNDSSHCFEVPIAGNPPLGPEQDLVIEVYSSKPISITQIKRVRPRSPESRASTFIDG